MSSSDDHLQANYSTLAERIRRAAAAAGRPASEITLVAVSKTFAAVDILAVARCGQRHFGENYAQEALAKMAVVRAQAPDLEVKWHFIGPMQSNKTRTIAEQFDWVQSVGRFKIAQRLSGQRPQSLPPLNVLLQVNISGEASKSGVTPLELPALSAEVSQLPRLQLRGLMAIPEPTDDPAEQHHALRTMKHLFDSLRSSGFESLDTLSMGMSTDLEAAIAEGATMVRIGTAIFGARPPA